MKKHVIIVQLALLVALCLTFSNFCFGGEFKAFGNKDYVRETGEPQTIVDNFNIYNLDNEYLLKIYNGSLQDDAAEFVSSSEMYINDIKVIGSNNFNQNTSFLEVPLSNQLTLGNNTISVELRGKPGGILTVNITGICPDISIMDSPLTSAFVGKPYREQIVAASDSGKQLIYSLIEFPNGMAIDSSKGKITWMPSEDQAGSNNVTVEVTDGTRTASLSYTILVSLVLPVISQNISAATGGVIEITDPSSSFYGASLTIPPGAIDSDTVISIGEVVLPPPEYSGEVLFGPPIALEPDWLKFNMPVTLSIPYSESMIPSGIEESNIEVDVWMRNLWMPVDFSVDTDNNIVTISLNHFSIYSALKASLIGFLGYSTPTGRFLIKYKTLGSDAVPGDQDYIESKELAYYPSGIPEYVADLGYFLEYAYARLSYKNYNVPTDRKIIVKLRDLETETAGKHLLGWGVENIVIENDMSWGGERLWHPKYDKSNTTVQQGLRTTSAHELFHVVQNNSMPDIECFMAATDNDNLWLFESTADWIVDEIWDDVDFYIGGTFDLAIYPRKKYTGWGLCDEMNYYNSMVFLKYLSTDPGRKDILSRLFTNSDPYLDLVNFYTDSQGVASLILMEKLFPVPGLASLFLDFTYHYNYTRDPAAIEEIEKWVREGLVTCSNQLTLENSPLTLENVYCMDRPEGVTLPRISGATYVVEPSADITDYLIIQFEFTGDIKGNVYVDGSLAATVGTGFRDKVILDRNLCNFSTIVINIVNTSFTDDATIKIKAFYDPNPKIITKFGGYNYNKLWTDDMNDKGQIVCYALPPSWDYYQAFLYDHETNTLTNIHHLVSLGADWSKACGINNEGQIGGYAGVTGGHHHAFLYNQDTGLSDIHHLVSLGGNFSCVTGINNEGQIVGVAWTPTTDVHAFFYDKNIGVIDIHHLVSLGGDYSWAEGINDKKQIVGGGGLSGAEHAFFYDYKTNTVTDIHHLVSLGGDYSWAGGINNEGQIVGEASTPTGDVHAFFYDKNIGVIDIHQLFNLEGNYSFGSGINNKGQIALVAGQGLYDEQRYGVHLELPVLICAP